MPTNAKEVRLISTEPGFDLVTTIALEQFSTSTNCRCLTFDPAGARLADARVEETVLAEARAGRLGVPLEEPG